MPPLCLLLLSCIWVHFLLTPPPPTQTSKITIQILKIIVIIIRFLKQEFKAELYCGITLDCKNVPNEVDSNVKYIQQIKCNTC